MIFFIQLYLPFDLKLIWVVLCIVNNGKEKKNLKRHELHKYVKGWKGVQCSLNLCGDFYPLIGRTQRVLRISCTPLIPPSATEHARRANLPSAQRAPTERFSPSARRASHRAISAEHPTSIFLGIFCVFQASLSKIGDTPKGCSVGRSASARQDCSASMLGGARWD